MADPNKFSLYVVWFAAFVVVLAALGRGMIVEATFEEPAASAGFVATTVLVMVTYGRRFDRRD